MSLSRWVAYSLQQLRAASKGYCWQLLLVFKAELGALNLEPKAEHGVDKHVFEAGALTRRSSNLASCP
jgi:hypothetical protein